MADNTQTVFRKKTLDRIASPEQLTDYLRVTNPGIWVILVAVILLLAGVFAWSVVGTLETKAEVKVVVSDHTAQVIALGPETLAEGMPLCVGGQDYLIAYTKDKKRHHIDVRILKKKEDYIVRIRDDCAFFDPIERLQLYSERDPLHHVGLRMISKTAKSIQYTCVLKLNILVVRI